MAGRPTDYTEEVLNAAKDYLADCVDTVRQVVSGQSEKFTTYTEKVTVKLPSIEGLARFLQISKETIYQWEKIHDDFSDVLHALRAEQADRLINNGLAGDYNPAIAKMLLTKHGYSDRTELSGPDGNPIETAQKLTEDQFTQLLNAVNEKSNPG